MLATSTPATRKLTGEDLIRIRASTNEHESTVVEWEGQVLYVDFVDLYLWGFTTYFLKDIQAE